jgi:hypothetical protein
MQLPAFNPVPGGVFDKFVSPMTDGSCEGCSVPMAVHGKGIKIPGLRGVFCSVECIEMELFGHGGCSWCGAEMTRPYTSLDSRLCSDDCSRSYKEHVLGDRAAALGTGKRFVAWLQVNRPMLYRELTGGTEASSTERYCQNLACPNGSDGWTANLAHLRAGTRFCTEACKKQARRSPNPQNRASKTPVFIGVSRDTSEDMDLGA